MAIQPLARLAKQQWKKLIGIEDTTESILRGLTLGMFVGLLPLMGIQILIVVFIAILLRVNKISAAMAVFVTNPFTVIPIYLFNLKVGIWLCGTDVDMPVGANLNTIADFARLGIELLVPLLFGSLLVASIGAILTYFLMMPVLYRYHHWRVVQKREKRKEEQCLVEPRK